MATIREIISEFIKKSKTVQTDSFGETVLAVNDRVLGQLVKKFRESKGVQAKLIGEKIGYSKAQMNFLENGKKKWDMELLKGYMKAVKELSKNSKTEK